VGDFVHQHSVDAIQCENVLDLRKAKHVVLRRREKYGHLGAGVRVNLHFLRAAGHEFHEADPFPPAYYENDSRALSRMRIAEERNEGFGPSGDAAKIQGGSNINIPERKRRHAGLRLDPVSKLNAQHDGNQNENNPANQRTKRTAKWVNVPMTPNGAWLVLK
jgi:hypothetical protein